MNAPTLRSLVPLLFLALSAVARPALAESADLRLGGSAAITACAAARLGLSVAFVGLVGDDAYGAFCVDALRRRGVDTASVTVDPSVSTGLTVILQRDGEVRHEGSELLQLDD